MTNYAVYCENGTVYDLVDIYYGDDVDGPSTELDAVIKAIEDYEELPVSDLNIVTIRDGVFLANYKLQHDDPSAVAEFTDVSNIFVVRTAE